MVLLSKTLEVGFRLLWSIDTAVISMLAYFLTGHQFPFQQYQRFSLWPSTWWPVWSRCRFTPISVWHSVWFHHRKQMCLHLSPYHFALKSNKLINIAAWRRMPDKFLSLLIHLHKIARSLRFSVPTVWYNSLSNKIVVLSLILFVC